MRMPALTALRFFTAAAVVLFHASDEGLLPRGLLAWCLPAQAVSVFFVLSGFVLQSAYGGDLRKLSAGMFPGQRVARV